MAENKLKFFQLVQNIYRMVGIYPPKLNQHCLLNSKISFFLLMVVQFYISSFAFLLFEANSIREMADSFYVASSELLCITYMIVSLWKISDILDLITKYERFIEKSE